LLSCSSSENVKPKEETYETIGEGFGLPKGDAASFCCEMRKSDTYFWSDYCSII
jgi:hypothetical protein